MELTKAEIVVLMSLVSESIGIEALNELLGEKKVSKLDAIATDLAGNTTPYEMALIGPSIISKLTNRLLEEKDEVDARLIHEAVIRCGITVEEAKKLISSEALKSFMLETLELEKKNSSPK